MLCRRKIVIICAFLSTAFFTLNRLVYLDHKIKNYFQVTSFRRWTGSKLPKPQKIVILYSNQRSGSTFLGEIFNRNPAAFYLYEPLFPFTPHCTYLNKERLNALSEMMKCNFQNNIQAFQQAQRLTKYDDRGSGCLRNNICFASRSEYLLRKQAIHCKKAKTCGYPMSATVLSSVCENSDLIAYKVLRVCSLEAIEDLYTEFRRAGKNVFVVHLVRDPRAIISSKLRLELKEDAVEQRSHELCTRMQSNLQYIDGTTDAPSIVKDMKYIRFRYEDIASDPILSAEKIYSFLGLTLPHEVRNWINVSTLSPRFELQQLQNRIDRSGSRNESLWNQFKELKRQMSNPYGTVRDPATTIQGWRLKTPMKIIASVQNVCAEVMQILQYKAVKNETELVGCLDNKLW